MYASVGALFFPKQLHCHGRGDGEVENVVESNRCTISLVSVSEYQLRESVTRARKFERSIIE
jgi:hypothetical protein